MVFHPEKVDRFRLVGYDADPAAGTALLRYGLDGSHEFEERIDFGRGLPVRGGRGVGFERVIRLLHLAAGVSYYKAAAPRHIVVETGPLTEREAQLCRDLYDRGMREFAFRNGLEVPRDIDITVEESSDAPTSPGAAVPHGTRSGSSTKKATAPPTGIGVPIGGGKDSIVVLEAVRDEEPVLVSVNPNAASRRIASIADLDLVEITRTLDPRLLDLNANGALNGHVPVTAIVSLIAVAAGYLYDYDTTAMALENSADSPTRMVGTETGTPVPVNHQWSKSAEFETQLREVLHDSVHPSIRYMSPLRRFTELEITSAFATKREYFSAFRSCNAVSRLSDPTDSWCLSCPKCRFVFLALATALKRKDLIEMFGGDLLGDESQVQGFCDMLDAEAKPFECVGTVEEVDAAFRRLLGDAEWSGAVVLERVRPLIERRRLVAEPVAATPSAVFDGVRQSMARLPIA